MERTQSHILRKEINLRWSVLQLFEHSESKNYVLKIQRRESQKSTIQSTIQRLSKLLNKTILKSLIEQSMTKNKYPGEQKAIET